MKRTSAVFLALALLLTLLPVTALAAVGETPTDSYCPSPRSDNNAHRWGDWQTTKQPTCTGKGSKERTCVYCGYVQKQSIDKAGHKWGGWTVTREATCSVKGERARKCRVCGQRDTDAIRRLPHTWGEETILVEATDFSKGKRTHTCQVCGAEATEDFYPDPTYVRGDKGDDVKTLQEKLNAAGYDCGRVDGDFGRKTEAAVKAIEAAHGVEQDGIAWPGVQKWLGMIESAPAISTRNLPLTAPLELYVWPRCFPQSYEFAAGELLEFDTLMRSAVDMSGGKVEMRAHGDTLVSSGETGPCQAGSTGDPIYTAYTLTQEDLDAGSLTLVFGGVGYPADGSDAITAKEVTLTYVFTDAPALDLWADTPPAAKYKAGDLLHVDCQLSTSSGSALPVLTGLNLYNGMPNDAINLDASIEYNKSMVTVDTLIPFSVDIEVSQADIDRGWGYRELEAAAVDYNTGAPYTVSTYIMYAIQKSGASIMLLVQDTTGMAGRFGECVPLKCAVINNGDVNLKLSNLSFFSNTCGGNLGTSDYHDPYLDKENDLPAGVALPFINYLVVDATDVGTAQAHDGLFDRLFQVKAEPADPGLAGTSAEGLDDDGVVRDAIAFSVRLIEDEPDAAEVEPLEVLKQCAPPTFPDGFMEGETIHYAITVVNNGDEPMDEVEVYDPLKGGNEDMLIAMIPTLAPHAAETVYFDYVVTADDVDAGIVMNAAFATWFDEQEKKTVYSEEVRVQTWRPEQPVEVTGVIATKTVENLPARGYFFENETIDFAIRVENTFGWAVSNVVVTDPLSAATDKIIGRFAEIPGGGSETVHLAYGVTASDIGSDVVNIAYVEYLDSRGEARVIESNRCLAPTGENDDFNGITIGAEVDKAETSAPNNKEYYVEGEQITYEITVHNFGDAVIDEVLIFDTLGEGSGQIATIKGFEVDDTRAYTFTHTVSAEDVKHQ